MLPNHQDGTVTASNLTIINGKRELKRRARTPHDVDPSRGVVFDAIDYVDRTLAKDPDVLNSLEKEVLTWTRALTQMAILS